MRLLLKLFNDPYSEIEVGFKKPHSKSTESLGQFFPNENLDRVDGLSTEEISWARELGATTDEEVLDLVRKHEASMK